MDHKELLEQIDTWYNNDDHQEIVSRYLFLVLTPSTFILIAHRRLYDFLV